MALRPERDASQGIGSPQPRFSFRRHAGIAVVLALYLVLGTIYSIVTPIFEASDELWHYPFVKHLADGNGLPVQRADNVGPWRQEGSQPPLYYALGAALTFWIDTDDMDAVRRLNPHVDMGIITADRNVNMAIHGPAERWPYRDTVLAVHMVRWASVLMGAVTVFAGYLLARTIWPHDEFLAVGAAALTAFNAMFLFVTASVNNDALVIALSAVALWRIVAAVARPPTRAQWAVLGLLLGLNAITKASGLAMLPLAGLAIVLNAASGATPRRRPWRTLVTAGALVGIPVLLVAQWWYWRNWRLYDDPLGLNAFVAIVGARNPVPSLRQLAAEWKGFVMAYWGFFGGVNVPAPGWAYAALSILGGVGLAAAPLYVWQEWRSGRLTGAAGVARGLQVGLIALWPVAVFVALIRWTLMTIASQGRLMFPALTALSLLMAMGLAALLRWRPVPRAWRRAPLALAAAVMLAVAALLPWITIRPAYAHPPLLSASDLSDLEAHGVTPYHATFGEVASDGGRVELLGYRIEPAVVAPGESVAVTLYWRGLQSMDHDWSVFVHLLGANDIIIGQRDMYPGQGTYPTTLWAPGDAIADTYVVPVSPTTLTPTEAEVEVGLYRLDTGERLFLLNTGDARPRDSLRLGRVSLPERVVDGIPNPTHLNLGGEAALIGYSLDRTAAAPGETFHLTLYWEALADLDTNYSVFTHILGEQQHLWSQDDGWPLDGDAPTATWRKGQRIVDPYELTVAADASPGVYELEVGMYDASGARLSLLGPGGHVQDTRIVLGRVRVATPQ